MNLIYPAAEKLWQARLRLVAGAVIGLLLGCCMVLSIRPQFTVTMVVGPVSASGPAGMGTPAANLRDVQSANGGVGNGGSDALSDYDRYLQLLTSPAVAENLIKTVPGILPLFFPDRWDSKNKAWQLRWRAWPSEIINRVRGGTPWQAPTAEDLSQRLTAMLQRRVLGATPMRELQLRHRDRGFAITLLYALHQSADNVLREEAARRSAAISDYIEKQLETVKLQEHRQVLSELLAQQERIRILVSVDLPYAADVIEAPSAPLQPDTPQPWPIVLFGGIAGFLTASLLVTLQVKFYPARFSARMALRHANRNDKKSGQKNDGDSHAA